MRTIHAVLTTHWDREWVQSFEQYRFRLSELMDRAEAILVREPELTFVTDGQTVMIEDYLAIRPEMTERIRSLVVAKRLVVGPWYVLADQFLEGDEATIRNLLTGRAIAESLGGRPMAEGYVPDSFGSIATLPLILNGFGITTANAGRGVPSRPDNQHLFNWTWKDGSHVLALDQGYANAISLAYPDIWKRLDCHPQVPAAAATWATQWMHGEASRFPGDHLYASVGIDHMELRPGMTAALAAVTHATDARWLSSTPEAYLAAAQMAIKDMALTTTMALPTVVGELRGDLRSPMNLQGVLSTDAKLKRRNRRAELALQWLLEPLEVLRHAATGEPVRHIVTRAWKHLLVNHAHDSISACSLDRVMEDIHGRLRQVAELTDIAAERWLRDLMPPGLPQASDEVRVTLFNPLPARGHLAVDHVVRVPGLIQPGELLIHDLDNRLIGGATVVAHRQADLETQYATDADLLAVSSKQPAFTRDPQECWTLLRLNGSIQTEIAGEITLRLSDSPWWQPDALPASDHFLDNGLIRMEVADDGSLTLIDLRDGRRWTGLGWFEDCADAGDTYDFEPLTGDVPIRSTHAARIAHRLTVRTPWLASLVVTTHLQIPARLADGAPRDHEWLRSPRQRQSIGQRSTDQVELIIETTCTIRAGIPWVELTTQIVNHADHHRLRVGLSSVDQPTVTNGGHFAQLTRAWSDPLDRFPCRPMLDWVHRGDGLAIIGEGLYEMEARPNDRGGDKLVTLLRSCDTIGPAAGMNFPVENARALGAQESRYWLAPAATVADAARLADAILVPSLACGHRGTAPVSIPTTLCHSRNPRLRVTAIKRAERGNGTIVRLANLGGATEDPQVSWEIPHGGMHVVGLDEEPRDGIAMVPPWGVLALRFVDLPLT